jgi:hypothetical protein
VQSELKVRPGFGAVAMKNVRKTKCAEQDRTCRQVQFKSVSDPDAKRAARIDGFGDKAQIPALAGCPEHGERGAPDLDADAVARKTYQLHINHERHPNFLGASLDAT